MIGFIETASSGGMVPISAIIRIGEERVGKDKIELRTAKLFDGSKFDLLEHDIAEIRSRPAQIIPSEPGTQFVRAAIGGTLAESVIVAEPVIAWALCLDGAVRPVTPQGVCGGASFWDDHYVEMPAGDIYAVGDVSEPSSFTDRDEMLRRFFADAVAERVAKSDSVKDFAPDALPHAAMLADWCRLRDRYDSELSEPDNVRNAWYAEYCALEVALLDLPTVTSAQASAKLRLLAEIELDGNGNETNRTREVLLQLAGDLR